MYCSNIIPEIQKMDNRNFTRVNHSVGASISYGNQVAICSTGNLSLRGMYLRTGYEVPLNVPVNVTVYHSDQMSFKVNAMVVRKEENGIGLQITNLDIDSFVQLRDIVAEQSNNKGAILQETYKMLKCIN
jgi:hypothetical protein